MMDFTTLGFLGYVAAAAVVYRGLPVRLRPALILAVSYAYYWLAGSGLILLLVCETLLVFAGAQLLQKTRKERLRQAITFTVVALLIGVLVLFKGAFMLPSRWAGALLMPLGVSYYTFKLVGYLVDVYWRANEAEANVVNFAAYSAFFPQIVAGPIQRAESFLPQIRNAPNATSRGVLLGCQRILLGFFKKFVVADNLGTFVNYVYSHLHGGGEPILLGFYGYPLQMYADFSALTDIAVGAALLFGITSPENFEAPFAAVSPTDYWRRWHITLTLWLTDYVFTPLRMSTRSLGNVGLVFSLVVNMVLIGLWHGFRWTFVIFGLVHAFYLAVDALSGKRRRNFYKANPRAKIWAGRIGPLTTFHLIAIGFVCFRASTPGDIVYVLRHLFANVTNWSEPFASFFAENSRTLAVGAGGYAVAEVFDFMRRRDARQPLLETLPRWGRWSAYSCSVLALCLLAMLLFVKGNKPSPFLYAIF
jgi:alginate O-acetyltransferase complex protein AlgI